MMTILVQAVEALPEEQREVFLLREVANLPFKEIAEVTGRLRKYGKEPHALRARPAAHALADFEEYARALR